MLLLYEELASGNTKPIPWKKLLPQVRGCVAEAYLPPAHLEYLTEPSSMRDNQCHTLLTFWYQQQLAGHSPVFRFHKYLVQDELVDANPRELVEAEDDDEAEVPAVSTLPKGKNRDTNLEKKRRRSDLTSSKRKGKQRESSPVMSSDSSKGEEFIGVGSDVTDSSDETDDGLHDLGLTTLYDDSTVILKVGPPTAGPSTTRRQVEPTAQPSRGYTGTATPSTAQPASSSPPTSTTVTFTPQSQDNFRISKADVRQGIPRAAGSVIPAPNRDDRDGLRNLRPDLLSSRQPTPTLTLRDDESHLRNYDSLTLSLRTTSAVKSLKLSLTSSYYSLNCNTLPSLFRDTPRTSCPSSVTGPLDPKVMQTSQKNHLTSTHYSPNCKQLRIHSLPTLLLRYENYYVLPFKHSS